VDGAFHDALWFAEPGEDWTLDDYLTLSGAHRRRSRPARAGRTSPQHDYIWSARSYARGRRAVADTGAARARSRGAHAQLAPAPAMPNATGVRGATSRSPAIYRSDRVRSFRPSLAGGGLDRPTTGRPLVRFLRALSRARLFDLPGRSRS